MTQFLQNDKIDRQLSKLFAANSFEDKNITLELVKCNECLLKHIPSDKKTKEICLCAIENTPSAIEFIDCQVDYHKACLKAIEKECFSICKIKNKTYDMYYD